MTDRDRAILSLVLIWIIRVMLAGKPLLSVSLDARADELIAVLSEWGSGK